MQLLTTALILALAWGLSAMIAELGSASYLAELLAEACPIGCCRAWCSWCAAA